jgi:hypothetical protein
MDPGSAPLTRLVRDDGAFVPTVQAFAINDSVSGQPLMNVEGKAGLCDLDDLGRMAPSSSPRADEAVG